MLIGVQVDSWHLQKDQAIAEPASVQGTFVHPVNLSRSRLGIGEAIRSIVANHDDRAVSSGLTVT